jgi:clathrin heavy chain
MLQQHGFDSSLIKHGVLAFESDKFICAKEVDPQGNANVIVCDVGKNFEFSKRKITAEGVMMHPTRNVMAVRAKNNNSLMIQVYDLDSKSKLKDITVNFDVTFWTWINNSIIGLVSPTSVFLLSIDDMNSPARKIFDRQGNLANSNVFVMRLKASDNLQWFTLAGISAMRNNQGQNMVVGYIQLFNTQQNASQPIEGFCPCFGNVKCIDDTPSNLLSFVDKKANMNQYKIIVTALSQRIFEESKSCGLKTLNKEKIISKTKTIILG